MTGRPVIHQTGFLSGSLSFSQRGKLPFWELGQGKFIGTRNKASPDSALSRPEILELGGGDRRGRRWLRVWVVLAGAENVPWVVIRQDPNAPSPHSCRRVSGFVGLQQKRLTRWNFVALTPATGPTFFTELIP